MKIIYRVIIVLLFSGTFVSCKKYLDIVPDNVATIDYAFRMRNTAERYLFTCYSFMPNYGDFNSGFIAAGDEIWWPRYPNSFDGWEIPHGTQNVNAPYLNFWNSSRWRAIRDCNIFLENVESVPDLLEDEKKQWIAEVKFLKAYYHFFLMKLYGPIPLMRKNIPIDASSDEVRVKREPVDEGFKYIVELLDEAIPDLLPQVQNINAEAGRITVPVAMGIKAKILVYAASPLFNGNPDYIGFTNKDGTPLFNPEYSEEKWVIAAEACKEAIEMSHSLGHELYRFVETPSAKGLSDETKLKMNIRNMFTERWNEEVLWANTNTNTIYLQQQATVKGLDPAALGNSIPRGEIGVPMKIPSKFYTKNGVPIDEDNDWKYTSRFNLRVGTAAEKYYIKEGYTTAEFNFDREPRFYATFGFDGGIWFGNGRYADNNPAADQANWYIQGKIGQYHGKDGPWTHAVSGYYAKKYIHYTNVMTITGNVYTIQNYPWIMLRLGDLYLLHAEAMNEAYGPGEETYLYIDAIRARSGLEGVVKSWAEHSRNPNKPTTKEGLRDIIRQERTIEMALETQRLFDVRRWKTAIEEYNAPITGWDVDQSITQSYYREKVIYNQTFSLKDYFWPIREYDLIVNKNLVQNPGW